MRKNLPTLSSLRRKYWHFASSGSLNSTPKNLIWMIKSWMIKAVGSSILLLPTGIIPH
jgi:hypothetical protein